MSQKKLTELFELMCDEGIKHFKRTIPEMELTDEGYKPTGEELPVWKSGDVTAFTGLLKMADYKHVEGISDSPQALRDDLAARRNKRNVARDKQNAEQEKHYASESLPPIKIEGV